MLCSKCWFRINFFSSLMVNYEAYKNLKDQDERDQGVRVEGIDA